MFADLNVKFELKFFENMVEASKYDKTLKSLIYCAFRLSVLEDISVARQYVM